MGIIGWVVNLFKYNTNNKVLLEQVHESVQKNPDDLLTEATARKVAGDLENAIILLREAYKEIRKGSISYPVETFLRLPLYLQKAKRSDEAWQEFNLLLTKGYPNQMNTPELIPMDHYNIYDKMRLFLQREGKNKEAVKYGIFSYLSWAIGLYRQKRKKELGGYIVRDNYEEIVKKLLKKAQKEELIEKISNIIGEQLKYLPNIDFNELVKKLSFLEY